MNDMSATLVRENEALYRIMAKTEWGTVEACRIVPYSGNGLLWCLDGIKRVLCFRLPVEAYAYGVSILPELVTAKLKPNAEQEQALNEVAAAPLPPH